MNLSPPRIALCVPAYNAARHLPRLFASVNRQTVPFSEVWVYDDCSDDNTSDVARQWDASVNRGEVNRGCSFGKNVLLKKIVSEWVHFHDADDELAPEFVERALRRIAAGDFDALLFNHEQFDVAAGKVMSARDYTATDILDDPVRFNLLNTINNCGVYRSRLLQSLGGFDLNDRVRYNEDRAFHLKLALSGARFALEPYTGCRFNYSGNSMSAANRLKCCQAQFEILKRFHEAHPDRYSQEVSGEMWRYAGHLASFLDWESADECVRIAQKLNLSGSLSGSLAFRCLCRVSPQGVIRVREWLIRLLRPHLRRGY